MKHNDPEAVIAIYQAGSHFDAVGYDMATGSSLRATTFGPVFLVDYAGNGHEGTLFSKELRTFYDATSAKGKTVESAFPGVAIHEVQIDPRFAEIHEQGICVGFSAELVNGYRAMPSNIEGTVSRVCYLLPDSHGVYRVLQQDPINNRQLSDTTMATDRHFGSWDVARTRGDASLILVREASSSEFTPNGLLRLLRDIESLHISALQEADHGLSRESPPPAGGGVGFKVAAVSVIIVLVALAALVARKLRR
jgi:hypothetical protein